MLRPETVIIGRLGNDPEVINAENLNLCRLSVAVNYSYKKDSEIIKSTDWFTLEAWGSQALLIIENLKKGDLAAFRVLLRDGSYTDKDGKKVYKTTLTVSELKFLEPRDSKGVEHFTANDIPL